MMWKSDLPGAVFVIRAVILVNDNGVVDVDHDDVSEKNISHKPFAWSSPRFYSHTILCIFENYIFNPHIIYTGFFNVLA